jgi:methyltransferase (TIGR00027 family)
MSPDRASYTAEVMALFRALESQRRPAVARLFEDPFAFRLLGRRLRPVAAFARIPGLGAVIPRYIDRHWPGARSSAVARTRLIDDALTAALAEGVGQVVILGAGFDCRPYRLRGIERARVFEVDHPATSAVKRVRMAGLLGTLPHHVAFVAVDFDRQPFMEALEAAGYAADAPTFFLWEGVTNYLTAPAVDATLVAIAAAAAGSRLLFTYVHRGVLDGSVAFEGTAALASTLERSGEPWTFGLDPAELPGYLTARGLILREDLGANDYRARYLGSSGRHQRGYAFYRAARADVARRNAAQARG